MHVGELVPPYSAAFVPDVIGTSTAGAATYAADGQLGRYVKMGPMVFVWFRLSWTAHTGTGDCRVTGLPFRSNSRTNYLFHLTVVPGSYTYTNSPFGNIPAGENYVDLRSYVSAAGSSTVALDTSAVLQMQGFYLTEW